MRVLLLLAVVACRDAPAKKAEPVLAIDVAYAGASAEVIEREIAMPFEQAAHGLGHATEARIEEGHTTIFIERGDLERATHELRHVELPAAVPPPVFGKRRKDDTPILVYEVRGALPVAVLSRQARAEIEPQLARIPGIARIAERNFAREVTVATVDLQRLGAYGVTLAEVLAAIERKADVVRDAVRVGDVATIEQSFERDASAPPTLELFAHPDAEPAKVLVKVREVVAALPPGVTLHPASPKPARPRASLTITVIGPDASVADAVFSELRAAGISNVTTDPPPGSDAPQFRADRAKLAELGVDAGEVSSTLRALLGSGTVVVRFAEGDMLTAVGQLHVRNRAGALVPLSSVVSVEYGSTRPILRRNGERVIALAITAPKDKLALARRLASERVVPVGYRIILTP